MQRQEAGDQVWKWLTGTAFLLGPLTALLIILLLSLILPQSPVSPTEEAAFARWVAEVRPTLGRWGDLSLELQLLTLRTSFLQRISLALLSIAITARISQLIMTWRQQPRFERIRQIATAAGVLLLIAGWGTYVHWGWIAPNLTIWPGEAILLSEHDISLPPLPETTRPTCHGYGVYVIPERHQAIGLETQSTDDKDNPVSMVTSTQSTPQETLRLILNDQKPEAYFAIPSAGLIFRATLQQATSDPTLLIQIYRSASGELITETILQGDGSLFTDNIRLQLQSTPLPQVHVIYNPGAPLTATGWSLLFINGLGWISTRIPGGKHTPRQVEKISNG